MMAGPEPDMRAEQTYLKLLAEAKKFKVDGKTLTLSDANGNELAHLHAPPLRRRAREARCRSPLASRR